MVVSGVGVGVGCPWFIVLSGLGSVMLSPGGIVFSLSGKCHFLTVWYWTEKERQRGVWGVGCPRFIVLSGLGSVTFSPGDTDDGVSVVLSLWLKSLCHRVALSFPSG